LLHGRKIADAGRGVIVEMRAVDAGSGVRPGGNFSGILGVIVAFQVRLGLSSRLRPGAALLSRLDGAACNAQQKARERWRAFLRGLALAGVSIVGRL
jgi:hypothetical protein